MTTDAGFRFVTAESLRRRSRWFVAMRWFAAAGALLLAVLAIPVGGLELPLGRILLILLLLLAANLVFHQRNRRAPAVAVEEETRWLKYQMVSDLFLLAALMHLSGGIENPLQLLFIVHVIIAGLLLRGRDVLGIALMAGLLFTAVAVGEHVHLLHHHHLLGRDPRAHSLPFLLLDLAVFWVVLAVCTVMALSIMNRHRAIRDELLEQHRRLVAADHAKMDFFRFVTHELKNPVITAQSAIEAVLQIEGPRLSDSARDMLERSRQRLAQATDIVKDLADLTRGRLDAERESSRVDVRLVVEDVLAGQGELIARRGLVVEKRLPDRPVVLVTSPTSVEKIVLNLVSNAVRYNREGGLLLVAVEDRGDEVVLTVADEGIGIAPQDREKIFDEFYRAPAAKKISNLGTGLGLPIVKRFVDQLGGRIELHSVVGDGTTFHVHLPRREEATGRGNGGAGDGAPPAVTG